VVDIYKGWLISRDDTYKGWLAVTGDGTTLSLQNFLYSLLLCKEQVNTHLVEVAVLYIYLHNFIARLNIPEE